MFLLNILITVLIMMMLLVGGIYSWWDALILLAIASPVMLVTYLVIARMGNRLGGFLAGEGAMPESAGTLRTERGDSLVVQGEYDAALYMYEQDLKRATPKQRGPHMCKIAETAQLAGRWDEALRWWAEALRQPRGLSEEEQARAYFHIAEIRQMHFNDPQGAARTLADLRQKFPGSKYATFAEERLRNIVREPPSSPG